MSLIEISYATSSSFKREEIKGLLDWGTFVDAWGEVRKISDHFTFEFSGVKTDEPLEIDLIQMVKYKARSAYRQLLAPCIVEHAGIILQRNYGAGFPGGLTQPMWDALGAEEFLRRTGASGEEAVARAVIGYCDGMKVRTFVGETKGFIAASPRGSRDFYWDTVFEPSDEPASTYAEIVQDPKRGLQRKMEISQSAKALVEFLGFRHSETSALFARVP